MTAKKKTTRDSVRFTKLEKGLPLEVVADDVQGVEAFDKHGATVVAILMSGGHTIEVQESFSEACEKVGFAARGEKQA